jgi:multiple sugar transport system substrate-binding protein
MLTEKNARDFWHDPKYSEMLAAQQEGFCGYASGQIEDPKLALEWIACEQQKILYEAGRSKIAPPDSCKDVRLQ